MHQNRICVTVENWYVIADAWDEKVVRHCHINGHLPEASSSIASFISSHLKANFWGTPSLVRVTVNAGCETI